MIDYDLALGALFIFGLSFLIAGGAIWFIDDVVAFKVGVIGGIITLIGISALMTNTTMYGDTRG